MLGQNFEWSATGRTKASLGEFAGRQEVGFAFRRALSRLQEMQSEAYWAQTQGALGQIGRAHV
jgi:predicted ATPase